MIAAIRVRGKVNRPEEIENTLTRLRLRRKNVCVLLPEKPEVIGMLKKVKDVVTWGEIDKKTLEELVTKRGRLEGNKQIPKDQIQKIIEKLEKGEQTEIKPFFRLNPPRKGFERKGIKHSFKEGGALGYRREKINDLIRKML